MEPERGARQRILEAAMNMVGTSGLAALSMDELALKAAVSRATLYRLFPGKAVLFASILRKYSPLEPVSSLVESMRDQPPEVVIPEIARVVFRTVYGSGAPRIGLLRSVLLEVTSLSPDSEEAARDLVTTAFGTVGTYVLAQMAAGRLRRMHPLLAMQSLVGPVFFHILTRDLMERVIGIHVDGEEAVTELARNWLRGMKPDEEGERNG
jgi:AcrR family transcriptional regulator